MDIKEIGSGIWVFGSGSFAQMDAFPQALALFKRENPNLRVTAMTPLFGLFKGQIDPRGYVVDTEEK